MLLNTTFNYSKEVLIIESLLKLRNDLGLTQTQIAREIKISVQRYNSYETGKRNLPVEVAKIIAKKYNMSLDIIYAN